MVVVITISLLLPSLLVVPSSSSSSLRVYPTESKNAEEHVYKHIQGSVTSSLPTCPLECCFIRRFLVVTSPLPLLPLLSPSTQINPITGSMEMASDTVVGSTVFICTAVLLVLLVVVFRGDDSTSPPLEEERKGANSDTMTCDPMEESYR